MKTLKIGDLLARLPIIQGGMGVGISLSGLASAVANQGGVGVISSAGLGVIYREHSKDYNTASIWGLREELRKAREKTKGIIGVNVMVAMSNFADMVRTAIAEKADIIFSGAGMPLNLPSFLTKGSKTKLAPIVSSARAAKLICEKWLANYKYVPDAIVVEGPKAGGHLGYKPEQITDEHFSLERLLPEIVSEVRRFGTAHDMHIPVIAAGGIYTGEDIYRIMELGADGVQMGTRFVTTEECDAFDGVQAELHRSLSTGHRDHPKSGGYAGPGHPQLFPGAGETRVETAQELSVQLHQDLRRNPQPLLHHHGSLQRLQRQPVGRIRFRRRQCLASRKDRERERADDEPYRRIRPFQPEKTVGETEKITFDKSTKSV